MKTGIFKLVTEVYVKTPNASQLDAKSLLMNSFKRAKHEQIWYVFEGSFKVSKRVVSSYTATEYKMSVQYIACWFIVNNSVGLQKDFKKRTEDSRESWYKSQQRPLTNKTISCPLTHLELHNHVIKIYTNICTIQRHQTFVQRSPGFGFDVRVSFCHLTFTYKNHVKIH